MEDDDLEPISDLKQRLLYTEQLNGIKFLTYRHEVLTREEYYIIILIAV